MVKAGRLAYRMDKSGCRAECVRCRSGKTCDDDGEPGCNPLGGDMVLGFARLETLFDQIEPDAEILEIFAGRTAEGGVKKPRKLSREVAKAGLRNGSLPGIQIRYHREGAWWWDTIISAPGGYRLVRIRHDAAAEVAGGF